MKTQKYRLLRAPALISAALTFSLPAPLMATTYTWVGTNSNKSWNATGNFTPAPTFNGVADLVFDSIAGSNHNALGANRIVRSISYGANIDTLFETTFRADITTGTAANLSMSATSGSASINIDAGATGNITLGVGTGATAGGGSLSFDSNVDVVHNGTGEFLINRPIVGANGFTKSGTGSMRIANTVANSFTGAVNVSGGRLIAASTASSTGDFGTASAIGLGGGILEIRTTSALAKSVAPSITVSAASTLAYNNTTATTQTLTLGTGAFKLDANLTLQNISADPSLNNLVNVTRNITSTGNLIVETYNNIASSSSNFTLGRVQLSGDNSGWSGNLVIAKGTAQLSGGNSSGTGGMVIGATGDSAGAGLAINQSTDLAISNNITVRSGGFRAIKNNGSGAINISLSGNIALEGNLTVDHGLDAGKSISLGGVVSGVGGLTVANSSGFGAVSAVVLNGTNTYTGATAVVSGRLVVAGSIGNSAVTVSGAGTVLATDAAASFGSTLAINNGAILAPGDAAAVGTATVTGATTFNNGTIFSWDINATGTSYDKLVTSALVDGDTAGGANLRIVAGDETFADTFWNSSRTWGDIFTTNGSTAIANWASIFNSITVVNSSFVSITPTGGSFSASGNTLTWTAVPEPTSALAGLLIASGLLRRRRG